MGRRGFLAAIGLAGGTAVALASPSLAVASAKPSNRINDPIYRRGFFPRGSVWAIPNGSLVVKGKRAIRSHSGDNRFDRNSFEVIFAKEAGKHPGHGTTTLTNSDGREVPLHLVQIRPNRYSAVIHRQPVPGGIS